MNPNSVFSKVSAACVVVLLGFALAFGGCAQPQPGQSKGAFDPEVTEKPVASSVKTIEGGFPSEKEKRQVLIWLKRSNLNRYGDRFGTDYRGGNPLYNPITGVMTSRYQYLVNRHPSKPWLAVDLRQVPDNLEDDEAAE